MWFNTNKQALLLPMAYAHAYTNTPRFVSRSSKFITQCIYTMRGTSPSRNSRSSILKTLRPRQDRHHFPYDIFNCIFLNQNVWISIKISLNFVPKCRINNIQALVQIMAWPRPDHKPLSEPMMIDLLMHICVSWSQWVKTLQWWHRTIITSQINNWSVYFNVLLRLRTKITSRLHITGSLIPFIKGQ